MCSVQLIQFSLKSLSEQKSARRERDEHVTCLKNHFHSNAAQVHIQAAQSEIQQLE